MEEGPFKGGLGENLYKEHIFEVGQDSGKVVRINSWQGLDDEEAHKTAKKLFEELEPRYGIRVVQGTIVVGHNPYTPDRADKAIYTVSPKIEGRPLNALTEVEVKEIQEPLDELLAKMISYYVDKFTRGEAFLDDIGPHQFMIDERDKSKKGNFIMVDLDPQFETDANKGTGLGNRLVCLEVATENFEKFAAIRLEKARAALREALDASQLRPYIEEYNREAIEDFLKR